MSALAHETVVAQPSTVVAPAQTEVDEALRLLGIDPLDENAQYRVFALREALILGHQAGAAHAGRVAHLELGKKQREAAADVLHALSCERCGGNDLACPDKSRFLILGNAAINAARTVTEG